MILQALTCLLATECGQLFANWLLTHFPLYPNDFCLSSTAVILTELSSYLLFECSFDRDLRDKLCICRSHVENAPHLLKALCKAVFPNVSESHTVKDEIDEHPIIRKSQRQRKGTKGSAKSFNPQAEKAFAVFKFSVPSNSQEVEDQITAVLTDQRDVLKVFNIFYETMLLILIQSIFLKFYLEILQRPEIAAAILSTCVHREVSDEKSNYDIVKEEMILPSKELRSTPAAFPMVQPMKACVPCLHEIIEY